MSDNTQLAVQDSAQIQKFGSDKDLRTLADRFLLFFNVPQAEWTKPDVISASLKAAQLVIRFGFTPGIHIYLVKRAGVWGAEESLHAWRESADKHARLGRFLYDIQTREMTPDEVKFHMPEGGRYTTDDVGYWARVIRFDIAMQYKNLGMMYDPTWVSGFWRKEAFAKKIYNEQSRKYEQSGKWESDTIPNQRTKFDVARRRAERAALKEVFSLMQLNDYDAAMRVQAALLHMEREMSPIPKMTDGTFIEPEIIYEEDGNVIWATDSKAQARQAGEKPNKEVADSFKAATVAEVAEVAEWNEAPPTDEEKAIMATDPYLYWQGAPDAYAWAIEMGACKNEFEARNSFKKVVTEKFDGKFTKNNQQVVFAAVHEHWLEKLGKKLADNPFDMETLPEIPA